MVVKMVAGSAYQFCIAVNPRFTPSIRFTSMERGSGRGVRCARYAMRRFGPSISNGERVCLVAPRRDRAAAGETPGAR